MIEVTITRQMLDTDLQSWFLNAKNAEHAKEEILAVFSEEPGDGYTWSEQDIWEQSRRDRRKFCVIDVPRQYENL